MKPSRLVTSGGVRRHTARGMRKITKAALVGGAAAAAIAATVGVAAPAQADTQDYFRALANSDFEGEQRLEGAHAGEQDLQPALAPGPGPRHHLPPGRHTPPSTLMWVARRPTCTSSATTWRSGTTRTTRAAAARHGAEGEPNERMAGAGAPGDVEPLARRRHRRARTVTGYTAFGLAMCAAAVCIWLKNKERS